MVEAQSRNRRLQARQSHEMVITNKITDWSKFRAFVKAHGDKTQAQMAHLREGEISAHDLPCVTKKKLGSREKKKTYGYQNARVQTASIYCSNSSSRPRKVVCVDESGMDSRDDYSCGGTSEESAFSSKNLGDARDRVNMIAALCIQH